MIFLSLTKIGYSWYSCRQYAKTNKVKIYKKKLWGNIISLPSCHILPSHMIWFVVPRSRTVVRSPYCSKINPLPIFLLNNIVNVSIIQKSNFNYKVMGYNLYRYVLCYLLHRVFIVKMHWKNSKNYNVFNFNSFFRNVL